MSGRQRALLLGFIGMIAGGVLLFSYAAHSSADPMDAGCSAAHDNLDRTLDQIRFASSAQSAISSAITYSDRSRVAYFRQIAMMRSRLGESRNPQIQKDLVAASLILNDQEQAIEQARAIVDESKNELRDGIGLLRQAATPNFHRDCSALSLVMQRSGWPKDHLVAQLANAAQLNARINAQLNSAIALITDAQALVR